ncbi:hypothetical protein EVAR_76596_1 [Eumeta japonica]|uniref:Uncharacterized protein n=1 Tax=Eumeta variegata TaxID=151549 RepID=A0A4C1T7T4_EUMVA|nr:hypothetical protein EVAR_76596_1 [Eumeta japonica]
MADVALKKVIEDSCLRHFSLHEREERYNVERRRKREGERELYIPMPRERSKGGDAHSGTKRRNKAGSLCVLACVQTYASAATGEQLRCGIGEKFASGRRAPAEWEMAAIRIWRRRDFE